MDTHRPTCCNVRQRSNTLQHDTEVEPDSDSSRYILVPTKPSPGTQIHLCRFRNLATIIAPDVQGTRSFAYSYCCTTINIVHGRHGFSFQSVFCCFNVGSAQVVYKYPKKQNVFFCFNVGSAKAELEEPRKQLTRGSFPAMGFGMVKVRWLCIFGFRSSNILKPFTRKTNL